MSELGFPLTSVFLKCLPVHFKVTTRPEAHPSLKWRKSGLMTNTRGCEMHIFNLILR